MYISFKYSNNEYMFGTSLFSIKHQYTRHTYALYKQDILLEINTFQHSLFSICLL